MIQMKKAVLTAMVMACFFAAAYAQGEAVLVSPEAMVKHKVQVITTLNNKPEPAKVKVLLSGKKIAEGDAPKIFELDGGNSYKIEAFFPGLKNSGYYKIDKLSKDIKATINLEYYNVAVNSLFDGKPDQAAAADIRVYKRMDQAHPLEVKHTDGYSPAKFFLEAHKAYVFLISYDNHAAFNPNGKVIYDLGTDLNIFFDN